MNDVLQIVLPVFCLVVFGYLVAKTGYLSQSAGDGLADYVIKVAIPILLMRSLATAEFGDVNPWGFLATYFSAIAVTWLLASVIIIKIFSRGYRASVVAGVSATFSNLVLMGIPLIERAYGEQGLQIHFFLLSIHLPVMMVSSTFLMEYAVRGDGIEKSPIAFKSTAISLAKSLIKNPIIIGIGMGALLRITGISFSGIVAELTDWIAKTTGPLALISVGMSLVKYKMKGNLVPAVVLAVLSLVAMPAYVIFADRYIWELPDLWFNVALLCASCPTGVNAYLIANYFKIGEALSTNTIVMALIGSIITIPFWLTFAH